MPSYRSFVQHPPWRRLLLASTASRLPMTMGIFGLVLAGRALGSFALGGRLAALYTLTGAATSMWRGRRMDRGDLRRGLRRDGVLVAVVAAGIALAIATRAPALVAAGLAALLGLAMAAIPGGYRALVPTAAPPGEVAGAYALDSVSVEACFVTGPALAAGVAWFAGPGGVFVLMSAAALIGAVMAGRLPRAVQPAERPAAAPAPYRVPAMVGALIGAVAAGMGLGVLDTTFPPFAVVLGTRAAIGGAFVTLMALGSAGAGLLFGPRVAGARHVGPRAAALLLLFGVVVFPLAAAPGIGVVVVLAFVAGAPFALMTTSASVLIQRTVAPARTTEAFSMLNAGLLIGNAIGSGVASAAIGPAGARATMLIAGGGPLVGGGALLVAMAVRRRRVVGGVTAGVTGVS
jgi:hypothetical protein